MTEDMTEERYRCPGCHSDPLERPEDIPLEEVGSTCPRCLRTFRQKDREFASHTVAKLLACLADAPAHYSIILSTWDCVPGTAWTERFEVQIDHKQKVVRLQADHMS